MEPTQIIDAINAFKSVYEFLKETKRFLEKSKKRGRKMFSLKKKETIERRFKEALIGSKNAIESSIWFGKGFAIRAECGVKVDKEFHHLMALLIKIFNDISMTLVPERLDEKLVEHLQGQLEILENHAQRFWNIQGIHDRPDKEKDAMKIIENFRSRLWDFQKSMEPYLKQEEKEIENTNK